jgi:cyclophilin family peptidyl-prolyl cis-trans isomerase
MKSKIVFLLFLGMLNLQAQTTKKPVPVQKPILTKKVIATTKPISNAPATTEGIFATITTNKGDIVVQLEYQKTPITVANFISLAEGKNTFVSNEKLKGKPFYDGLKFHRVIADFMIQGGDPEGTGSGGPGYAFKDEFTDLKHAKGGILSMANSGPATNGSQFFITHKETPWLDGKHTIFGHVVSGMDIVNLIAQDDVIKKVSIARKGALAKQFDAPKVFSDYYAHKDEDAKKQALIDADNKRKQDSIMAVAKKEYLEKFASVIAAKKAYFETTKQTATVTASGLAYKITQKGTGIKPANGVTFNFNYAGYFEDGTLFDSSYADVCKEYGTFNPQRAEQNGYRAFPFEAGKKEGLIPGFIEGLDQMTYGDKAIIFIPSKLAYGERGAGGVIPPNTNIIFELEMIEVIPEVVKKTEEKSDVKTEEKK